MYLLQNLSSKHLYITAAYGIHKPCGVKSFITFIPTLMMRKTAINIQTTIIMTNEYLYSLPTM